MRVYRVERKKYLKSTLKGIGASLAEGFRWNSLNTFLVYSSESGALATLEVSVHLDLSEDLQRDRFYVEIDIPNDIQIFEVDTKDVPKNWDTKLPILETQYIGDDFVNNGEGAVLKVPSCVVPQEYNYLINPQHPDSSRITVISIKAMNFDLRIKQ